MSEIIKMLAETSVFLTEGYLGEEELNRELYRGVADFYALPSSVNYEQATSNLDAAAEHLKKAKLIGDLMDQKFIHYLRQRSDFGSIEKLKDVLPLRGAVALVPNTNRFIELNPRERTDNYEIVSVGMKRNGPVAEMYFPSKSKLEEELNAGVQRTIYRIKDFGIATGGTSVELVKQILELTAQGVTEDQIVVQGAVGTFMAQEKIREEFPNVTVMFSVEGEMPIERRAKEQLNVPGETRSYLELIAESRYLEQQEAIKRLMAQGISEEVAYKEAQADSSLYYVDKIRQVEGWLFQDVLKFVGGQVSPKDWGDQSFTAMYEMDHIPPFFKRLDQILTNNWQVTQEKELMALWTHFKDYLIPYSAVKQE